MRCPQCQKDDDKVLETRVLANGAMIRRRRQCVHCDSRFTSYERIEEQQLTVIKRNQEREYFDREKLEKGLKNAVRKRSVSLEVIESILDNIESMALLQAGNSKEIDSHTLGELVIEKLETIDEVAYLRFASVYRNFETIDEFVKEIKVISKHKKHRQKQSKGTQ